MHTKTWKRGSCYHCGFGCEPEKYFHQNCADQLFKQKQSQAFCRSRPGQVRKERTNSGVGLTGAKNPTVVSTPERHYGNTTKAKDLYTSYSSTS